MLVLLSSCVLILLFWRTQKKLRNFGFLFRIGLLISSRIFSCEKDLVFICSLLVCYFVSKFLKELYIINKPSYHSQKYPYNQQYQNSHFLKSSEMRLATKFKVVFVILHKFSFLMNFSRIRILLENLKIE